jgi:hypothetical protein
LQRYLDAISQSDKLAGDMPEKQLAAAVNEIYTDALRRLDADLQRAVPDKQSVTALTSMGLSASMQLQTGDVERLIRAAFQGLVKHGQQLNEDTPDDMMFKAVRLGLGLPADAPVDQVTVSIRMLRDDERAITLFSPDAKRQPWKPFPIRGDVGEAGGEELKS